MYNFKSLLGTAMEEFIELRCAQGYKRESYLYTLKNLDEICFLHYPQEKSLTAEIVHAWINSMSHVSSSYLYSKCCVIRNFGKFMNSGGYNAYILPDRFIKMKRSFYAHIFSDDELSRLFGAIDKFTPSARNAFSAYQLPVIFRLIYTCGLRPKEGRLLLWRNVNLSTGEILITNTKNKRDRIVVMSDDMRTLYCKYDELRRNKYPHSIYAFPSTNGKAYSGDWLSARFSECWANANPFYSKNDLPHVRVYDLRHQFASATIHRWLNEKRDLKVMLLYLQSYMGHCKLSSTAQYIHMLPEHLIQSSGIDWDYMNSLIPEVE